MANNQSDSQDAMDQLSAKNIAKISEGLAMAFKSLQKGGVIPPQVLSHLSTLELGVKLEIAISLFVSHVAQDD